MNIFKFILLMGIILFSSLNTANATTLNFDDVAKLNNYGGLKWENFGVTNGYTQGGGYDNGVQSGNNVAYNKAGFPAFITSSNLFTLNSAYITSAWREDLQIEAVGLNLPSNIMQKIIKNQLSIGSLDLSNFYHTSLVVNTTQSSYIDFNFENINTVAFLAHGGNNEYYGNASLAAIISSPDTQLRSTQFVMDNVRINEPVSSTPNTPEPSSMILGFLGLSGYIFGTRRKFA